VRAVAFGYRSVGPLGYNVMFRKLEMPHEHTPLYGERHNLAGIIFFFWVKIVSFRFFSRATISALFEGIPIRGSEVTSVLVFLFYFILFS